MGKGSKKILIIDDEKDLCFFLKENLKLKGGYDVMTATTAKRGLFMAYWMKPDMILLDIMMPGMDGFEVLKKLKSNNKTGSIPVIMLTALQDDASKIKAAGLYDEDYLTKPVEIDLLISRMREALIRKR